MADPNTPSPPPLPDPPPPPTPAQVARRRLAAAQYVRDQGVVWSKPPSVELRRQGPDAWWLTDSDDEYGHTLTRADLQALRDALDRELR